MTTEMKDQIAKVRAEFLLGKSVSEVRRAGYAEAAIRHVMRDQVAQ